MIVAITAMPVLGGKSNLFKAQPPKVRIEKIAVERPHPSKLISNTRLERSAASGSRQRPSAHGHRATSLTPLTRRKSISPFPNSTEDTRPALKRKNRDRGASRDSPASEKVVFDQDSDNEDDGWMSLDVRKKQRRGTSNGGSADSNRTLLDHEAFERRDDALPIVHAVEVASLATNCLPVMGARQEDVAIELQYPSLQPPERFELVWGKDRIDAVQASIHVVRHVADTYLADDEAEPFNDQNSGLIRRLEKASNRNIQDLSGYKKALHEYNATLLGLVKDGVVAKNIERLRDLPRGLVAFILDQVYDRVVAPKVELLSKYENGSDHVYGELLHPFISHILIDQTEMTSKQVFVDLGSGVGNVCLQSALEIGCESWGCEVMENACDLAEAQNREFEARCKLWGIKPGKVHLKRGDFRKNPEIHEKLKQADVILVNNKAFTSQLNDDLVRMFLDLKSGCKIISLRSFVADSKSSHNINDVGSTILDVKELAYPEGYVSWTHAGGPFFISTRK